MSSFTQFNGELNIEFSMEASVVLGKDYWLLKKGFTYDIGYKGSSRYVEVPKGFLSDGASIPFFVRGLIPTMGRHSQAAFLHDYLCETYTIQRETCDGVKTVNVTRKDLDYIFYEALTVSNFSKWRILLIRAGVDFYRWLTRPTLPKVDVMKIAMERSLREKNANK